MSLVKKRCQNLEVNFFQTFDGLQKVSGDNIGGFADSFGKNKRLEQRLWPLLVQEDQNLEFEYNQVRSLLK